MCICINCKFVEKCSIYHLIEEQHQQKTINLNCRFVPYSSIISVNILSDSSFELDWDLIECLSFIEEPGQWLQKN